MKRLSLDKISTVVAGYSFRTSVPHDPNGKVVVLQAGDIQTNSTEIIFNRLQRTSNDFTTTAFIQPGDVVMTSRSGPNGTFRAAWITDVPTPSCLATSSLIIIRPKPGKIDPGYLATYLNSADGQAALQRIASGSSVRTLRLKELAELPIPIPDPITQKTLVALANNINEQKDLIDCKRQLLDSILSTITSANR